MLRGSVGPPPTCGLLQSGRFLFDFTCYRVVTGIQPLELLNSRSFLCWEFGVRFKVKGSVYTVNYRSVIIRLTASAQQIRN